MGCATSIDSAPPSLPETPPVLASCTATLITPIPGERGEPLTMSQVVGAIGDQRSDAFSKARCSDDWKSFYEDLRQRLMTPTTTYR